MEYTSSREVKDLTQIVGKFHYRLNRKSNSDFCIDKVTVTNHIDLLPKTLQMKKHGKSVEVSVVGMNLPSERIEAKYFGYWTESKYGLQLKCTAFTYVTPDDKKGIEKFLCSSAFKGIGPALAKRIVDEFGMDTIKVIRENPDYLLRVRGVSIKKLKIITDSFRNTESYTRLSVFLSKFDISSNHIVEINNKLGRDAIDTIKENPFCLLDVKGIGFSTADKIARGLRVMLGSKQRVLGAINAILNEDSSLHGNLWTHITIVKKESLELLNSGFPAPVVTEQFFDEVFREAVKQKELFVHGKVCVFSKENEKSEAEAAKKLLFLLQNKIPEKKQNAYLAEFKKIVDHAVFKFSDDQIAAVSTVLKNRVAVLTGGPGTGKSTVSKAIIDSYTAVEGPTARVTLLAPTGKAARRLSETCGLPASTIHRACRIYDRSLHAGEAVTLPEGLIIIDESSMIDAYVMRFFMNCLRSEKYHVVFVGDADQLPSVAAGSVLKEMIDSRVVPCVKLTTTHRQGTDAGVIIEDAVKINHSDTNLEFTNRFKMVEAYNDDQAWQAIQNEYDEGVRLYGDQNVQILCPLKRKKRIAVDQLNKEMQEKFNPKMEDDISATVNGTTFRMHDKVIQMKNTEEASNGDTGTITRIHVDQNEDGDSELMFTIEWEDGRVSKYNKADMTDVELSYAMSIHKSQGCEFNEVIIPLMSSQRCPLFMKNLIYTAVTRAKERVVIIGDIAALNYCIKNDREIKRNSLFAIRLRAGAKKYNLPIKPEEK